LRDIISSPVPEILAELDAIGMIFRLVAIEKFVCRRSGNPQQVNERQPGQQHPDNHSGGDELTP
jgi:hypothetical protein